MVTENERLCGNVGCKKRGGCAVKDTC